VCVSAADICGVLCGVLCGVCMCMCVCGVRHWSAVGGGQAMNRILARHKSLMPARAAKCIGCLQVRHTHSHTPPLHSAHCWSSAVRASLPLITWPCLAKQASLWDCWLACRAKVTIRPIKSSVLRTHSWTFSSKVGGQRRHTPHTHPHAPTRAAAQPHPVPVCGCYR